MTLSYTPAQVEQFKRAAKQLRREAGIPHSQALDQIALANGFRNWALLSKHSEAPMTRRSRTIRPPLRFSRTAAEMRLAVLKVPEPRGRGGITRGEFAQLQVIDLSSAFSSPQNAVEFAIEYVTCLLTVPRFKLSTSAPAYWEMRAWLPYSCHVVEGDSHILVNRSYKPVGQVGKEWANYADFPHLHVNVGPERRKTFTAVGSSDGYLFNDACLPWNSRADAVSYLVRLRALLDAVNAAIPHSSRLQPRQNLY